MKTLQKFSRGIMREWEDKAVCAGYTGVCIASDAGLIQRVAARDQHALGNLYCRYYRRLYWFIGHINGHSSPVGVIINDVMSMVWDTAEQFRPGTSSTTWIFSIACNEALKSLARQDGIQPPGNSDCPGETCTIDTESGTRD